LPEIRYDPDAVRQKAKEGLKKLNKKAKFIKTVNYDLLVALI